jgi:hypothetical protein
MNQSRINHEIRDDILREIYVNMDCNDAAPRFDVAPNNIRIRSANDELANNSVQVIFHG